jgi:hypothetical protein
MKLTNFRNVLIKVGEVNRNGQVYTEESLRQLAEQDTRLVYEDSALCIKLSDDSLIAQATKYKTTGEIENAKADDKEKFE